MEQIQKYCTLKTAYFVIKKASQFLERLDLKMDSTDKISNQLINDIVALANNILFK